MNNQVLEGVSVNFFEILSTGRDARCARVRAGVGMRGRKVFAEAGAEEGCPPPRPGYHFTVSFLSAGACSSLAGVPGIHQRTALRASCAEGRLVRYTE